MPPSSSNTAGVDINAATGNAITFSIAGAEKVYVCIWGVDVMHSSLGYVLYPFRLVCTVMGMLVSGKHLRLNSMSTAEFKELAYVL